MKGSKKSGVLRDFSSSKEFEEFSSLLAKLTEKYKLSKYEFVEIADKQEGVPVTIFMKNLSPLEAVVRYMHEGLGFNHKQIGALLNRSPKTVWQAFNFGRKKLPPKLVIKPSSYYIPFSVLSDRKFSILENVVKHLVEGYNLRFFEIANLIYRDDRTIWTVYSRAKKKRAKHEG